MALAIDGEEGPFVLLSLAMGLDLNLKVGLERVEILCMMKREEYLGGRGVVRRMVGGEEERGVSTRCLALPSA